MKKEISLLRESVLNFQLDVEGTKSAPQVRLNLDVQGMKLSFPGVLHEGVAQVEIPELSFLEERLGDVDELEASLEVIVENQYFVPWSDVLSIKKEIRINAVENTAVPEKEEITVRVGQKGSDRVLIREKERSRAPVSHARVSEKLARVRSALNKEVE